MAARKYRIHQTEKTREKIRTTELLKLSHSMVFGDQFEGKDVKVSPEKVSLIKMLLAKTLPDMSSIQHSGDQKNPVKFTISND